MAAIPEVARAGEARGGRGDVDKAVTLEAEHQGVDELEAGGLGHVQDLQWKADITSLADTLIPTGFLAFMRANGADGLGGDAALLLLQKSMFLCISLSALGFNMLARSNLAIFRRHWETTSCFAIWLVVTFFSVARATRAVRGAHATQGFVAQYVNLTLTYVNGKLPPISSCIDHDPWMTATVASPEAFCNEDAGCEGMFNSGFVCAGTLMNAVVLGRTRARWQPVMAAYVGGALSMGCAAYCIGAHNFALARQLFLFLVFGSMTAFICESRRAVAETNSASVARILAMAQRSSDLLDTLIPPAVMQEASCMETPVSQSTLKNSDLLDTRIPPAVKRQASGMDTFAREAHGDPAEASFLNSARTPSFGLKLEKELAHVVIMFCVIQPELDGASKDAFSLLNEIFVAFDREVERMGMFKYHHFNNTFVVASPAAALRPDIFDSQRQEVENMLTLALGLKRLARSFKTTHGHCLSLGVGIAAGEHFSKVLCKMT